MSGSTMLGRLGYVRALRYKPKGALALLRMLWADYVLHVLLNRGTETCEDCGKWSFRLWTTSDELWRLAGPSGVMSGLLCGDCFAERCEERGVAIEFTARPLHKKKGPDHG